MLKLPMVENQTSATGPIRHINPANIQITLPIDMIKRIETCCGNVDHHDIYRSSVSIANVTETPQEGVFIFIV